MTHQTTKMGRILKTSMLLLMLVFLIGLNGCYYYNVTSKTKITPEDIRWEDFNNKYLILHSGQFAWHMVLKSVDSTVMKCAISELPANHKMYLSTNPVSDNRFIKSKENKDKYEGDVLNEVHIYTSGMKKSSDTLVTVDFASIQKMEIYRYSPGQSTASHIVPIVVTPITIAGVITLIIALTKSSCPYVYINSHNNYEFAGEIFSGAIYPSLERNDYLPLPGFEPSDGNYKIKIANKLPEIQHINLAELWLVQHPLNSSVLVDKNGVVHSYSSPQNPESVVSAGNKDRQNLLARIDNQSFLFDEDSSATHDTCARNSLVLTFNVPAESDTGKLILRAKNSVWGDYIYGEFVKQFGNKYGYWSRKLGRGNPEIPLTWKKDQAFPLMIYLETNNGWQFVDFFDLAGPLGFRDMVMPVNLSPAIKNRTASGNQVRIKIETGYMFWELDYVAMDFTPALSSSLIAIKPSSAISESGKKVENLVAADDHKYYEQPEIGNEVVLDFPAPIYSQDGNTTIFLHSKGYYVHVRHFQNRPDIATLETFRIPGRLSRFSFDRFSADREKFSAKYPTSPKEQQ
ncbi:MAG: hypothetical protein NT004_05000 [Bacteroidetes bacterium]|nr:hypothetical protein [Bacteroidota bacterium]